MVTSQEPRLPCRIRLVDGRWFLGELPVARHRAIQLGMLHADSEGLVELAAGLRRDGDLRISTRTRPDHFLPGGGAGSEGWLEALLSLADRHARRGEEVFFAPAVRSQARGDKRAVSHPRALWVDVDRPGQLHRLWALLAERPCHLLVETAGSGGVHCYWRLDKPLAARQIVESTGELLEPIEQAHLRLIHHLGVDAAGKPDVADYACRERSRILRLAGTVNTKSGKHARIIDADFELPPYPIAQLVGDLPDPAAGRPLRQGTARRRVAHEDPYKRIPPPEYFELLAGIEVPVRGGLLRCPAHQDENPSCSVGADATRGWCCFSSRCGARGAIYDLASVLLGGPWGHDLRGEEFKRAQAYVHDVFGEL